MKWLDVIVSIILLPVVLIGAALCVLYYILYFPLWMVRRELRWFGKDVRRADRELDK
jgi:hypothetical protein